MDSIFSRINDLSAKKKMELLNQLSIADTPRIRLKLSCRKDGSIYPLSFAQKRMWFLNQLEKDSSLYNLIAAYKVKGVMNIEAFTHAIKKILVRHEILNVSFKIINGEPVQILNEVEESPVLIFDLTSMAEEQQKYQIEKIIEAENTKSFVLEEGPLYRFIVIKLSDSQCILIIKFHHIIMDGWSVKIFLDELSDLYISHSTGTESKLQNTKLQYFDYAEWSNLNTNSESYLQAEAYWMLQLENLPRNISLPHVVGNKEKTSNGKTIKFSLSGIIKSELEKISSDNGVSLFMTCMAAFQIMISRYTNLGKFGIGTVFANRNNIELESVIGLFVNTIVIKADLTGNPRFSELLMRVKNTVNTASYYQDYPFDKLVERLNDDKRVIDRNPLVQVFFDFQINNLNNVTISNLSLEQLEIENRTSKFDLLFSLNANLSYLEGAIEFNSNIYDDTLILELQKSYECILYSIIENSEVFISQLNYLPLSEKEKILLQFNRRSKKYSDKTLHRIFEKQVVISPDSAAVEYEGKTLTFRDLNNYANRISHQLIKMGIEVEDKIAVLMDKSLELIPAILAIFKAGGIYVPIDISYPKQRIRDIISASSAKIVLSNSEIVKEELFKYINVDADITEENTENPDLTIEPSNGAYIIFTSGSTGTPKGVVIEHRTAANLLKSEFKAISAEAKYLPTKVSLNSSISFDFSILQMLYMLRGSTICLLPEEIRLNSRELAKYIVDHRVDLINCVPSQLKLLIDEGLFNNRHFIPQICLCGAEAIDAKLWHAIQQFRNTKTFNLYGPTECTVLSTSCQISNENTSPSIGNPLEDVSIYILNSELNLVPVGVAGEIYIGGRCLARGYLNDAPETAVKFLPDPFSANNGSRMYRSGDIGKFRPDGKIDYYGRTDEQVKIRGNRIELKEIEKILLNNNSIKDAVVCVKEDASGEKQIAAYIIKNETEFELEDVYWYLNENIPRYMIPQSFTFMDRFPVGSSGKVDKKSLPEPIMHKLKARDAYAEPTTKTEQILCGLWNEVLKINSVGIHDNFFELGGNSFTAAIVINMIPEYLNKRPSIKSIFKYPTIFDLSKVIDELSEDEGILQHINQDKFPLSYTQRRIWFLNELEPENPFYNMPILLQISGQLDLRVLENSINIAVRRNEMLRAYFIDEEGNPFYRIEDKVNISIPVIEYTTDTGNGKSVLDKIITEQVKFPINLSKAPLFNITIIKKSDNEHLLLMVVHHIIADGLSMILFFREAADYYSKIKTNSLIEVLRSDFTYSDFSIQQINEIKSEKGKKSLEYWKKKFAGYDKILNLPTDYRRPAVKTYMGSKLEFKFDDELVQQIKQFCLNNGVTHFIALLSAFKILLFKYSRQAEIVTGITVSNRIRREYETLIGPFFDTMAIKIDLTGYLNYHDVISQISAAMIEGYENRYIPFDVLVDELNLERDLSYTPLFQVMFDFQNNSTRKINFGDLTAESIDVDARTAKFDLLLSIQQTESSFECYLEYSTDLYEKTTIKRIIGHYINVLKVCLQNPHQSIKNIKYYTNNEEEKFLRINDRYVKSDAIRYVHEEWDLIAKKCGELPAIYSSKGVYSFNELRLLSNQIASYLIQYGVKREDIVGIMMPRSVYLIASIWGIMKSGAAYMPIDISYPEERIKYMLSDSGAKVILVDNLYRSYSNERFLSINKVLAETSKINIDVSAKADPENLAYVIYTSGSTGNPKGAMITHRGLSNYLNWSLNNYPIKSGSVFFTSAAFDATITAIFPTLSKGLPLTIAEEGEETENLLDILNKRKYGFLKITPAHLDLLEQHVRNNYWNLPVDALVVGGENLTHKQINFWQNEFPEMQIFNEYGPTETVVGCVVLESAKLIGTGSVPIGRVINGMKVYVLDEYMNIVPTGIPGELYIGGEGIARGYFRKPELTAEKFLPDPFGNPGERLYKTGDLVRYLNDDNLEFIDRIDNQVKIKGFRIELGEINNHLRNYPLIKDAWAAIYNDRNTHKKIAAYIVPSDKAAKISTHDLQEHLKLYLPDYMIPSSYVFIDEFPLNIHGKLDRKSLPVPELNMEESGKNILPPSNEIEITLLKIWQEVLNLQKISLSKNFFELGGDSILSIQMIAKAKKAGLKISAKDIFQNPTIQQLAKHIQKTNGIKIGSIAEGEFDLSPIQNWFCSLNLENIHHYNQSVLLEIESETNLDLLNESVTKVFDSHDSFRIRFRRENGKLKGFYSNSFTLDLRNFDISNAENPGVEIEKECNILQSSLNIYDGPIAGGAIFHSSKSNPLLFLTVHHLIIDAISWRIIAEDIKSIYNALASKTNYEIPRPECSYKEWCILNKSIAADPKIYEDLRYWKSMPLEKLKPLPVDYDNGPNLEKYKADETLQLNSEITKSLLMTNKDTDPGIRDILISALTQALYQFTGRQLFSINLESHGRVELAEIDISRTVGWFTSLYPVLLTLTGNNSNAEVLRSTKEQLNKIPRGGIAYNIIRYTTEKPELSKQLDAGYSEISFNYLGQFNNTNDNFFQFSKFKSGKESADENKRSHLIDVTCSVSENILNIVIYYSANHFKQETIRKLLNDFGMKIVEYSRIRETERLKTVSPEPIIIGIDSEQFESIYSIVNQEHLK